jgi:hypothetical protein
MDKSPSNRARFHRNVGWISKGKVHCDRLSRQWLPLSTTNKSSVRRLPYIGSTSTPSVIQSLYLRIHNYSSFPYHSRIKKRWENAVLEHLSHLQSWMGQYLQQHSNHRR